MGLGSRMNYKVTRWTVATSECDCDASVTHLESEEGHHHLIVDSLRAVVFQDGEGWIVHGLEIDYAAGGISPDDAKKRFARGLALTLHEHLKLHKSPRRMLRVAPQRVWDMFYLSAGSPESIEDVPDTASCIGRYVPQLTFIEQRIN